MNWNKWIKEHREEITAIIVSLAGLAASIIISVALPEHDDAND